jgi:hypothetical protein
MSKERFDIHQHLTDRIVSAIEAGAGQWQMPWHRGSGGRHPVNIASGNRYRGVNVLGLWVDAQVNSYGSHLWGTFRQWADKGATVRKGQKASLMSFSTRRLRSMLSPKVKTIPSAACSPGRLLYSMPTRLMASVKPCLSFLLKRWTASRVSSPGPAQRSFTAEAVQGSSPSSMKSACPNGLPSPGLPPRRLPRRTIRPCSTS